MKPKSLDTTQMIALNTRISCAGSAYRAELWYRKWCADNGFPIELWVVNYLRLYAKYAPNPKDTFINVKAAQRALEEA